MKVIWTQEASLDRQDIFERIATDNLSAAKKLNQQFDIAAGRLAIFPRLGRPGSQTGTREIFPHENYRLVYEIADDTVWIVALIHISRKWPPTVD